MKHKLISDIKKTPYWSLDRVIISVNQLTNLCQQLVLDKSYWYSQRTLRYLVDRLRQPTDDIVVCSHSQAQPQDQIPD